MELVAKTLTATFSAISNRWKVDLGEIVFDIHYIKIKGYKKSSERVAVRIGKITAEEVELEWLRDILILKKWKRIKKKRNSHELWNPDQPKNLAKSVTVR